MSSEDAIFRCVKCDDDVSPGRVALGYSTCLSCGSVAAAARTRDMQKMCVSQGHKQGLTYVADPRRQLRYGVNKVARDFQA